MYSQTGNRLGEASALCALGNALRATGDYPAATQALTQAFATCRQTGDRLGQANALWSLGTVLRTTGDYPAAIRAMEQALAIYRQVGNRTGEAFALNRRWRCTRSAVS